MAVEYILATDKLQSGFRAKYNLSVAEIITGFTDNGDGTLTANLFGGGTLTIDLTDSFFTKAEITALFAEVQPPAALQRVEFNVTSDASGEIDLSAETTIPDFPMYIIYPNTGPPQSGEYNPQTQIISFVNPTTDYLVVFIG